MTRAELFALFPRPWRMSSDDWAVIFDEQGETIARINFREGSATANDELAELIIELVNGAQNEI